jgi:DNA-binding transcriptional regulator YhcF (GntR family)
MLARGPNKHGVYIKESWGDEEDEQEDGLTQDELDDAIEEIEDLESDLTDALEGFSKFFPERAIELENFLRDD